MILFIKNMVSSRCKILVEQEIENSGLSCKDVELGMAKIDGPLSQDQLTKLRSSFLEYGFELLENKKAILVERIKNVIIEMVYNSDRQLKTNFSDFLSRKLNHDYTYLANIFSDLEKSTIEQYVILNKIKYVKELMVENNLSLTEISWKLNYSSVSHLSAQFKKVTGITPSCFKRETRLIAQKSVNYIINHENYIT